MARVAGWTPGKQRSAHRESTAESSRGSPRQQLSPAGPMAGGTGMPVGAQVHMPPSQGQGLREALRAEA